MFPSYSLHLVRYLTKRYLYHLACQIISIHLSLLPVSIVLYDFLLILYHLKKHLLLYFLHLVISYFQTLDNPFFALFSNIFGPFSTESPIALTSTNVRNILQL